MADFYEDSRYLRLDAASARRVATALRGAGEADLADRADRLAAMSGSENRSERYGYFEDGESD